jgi:GT2 family glycosyltransferase
MKTAVLVPCYKRPEYTRLCINSIEMAQGYTDTVFYLIDDGSQDGTFEILSEAYLPKVVIKLEENIGLRNCIIEFFKDVLEKDFTHIAKIDNDCTVPRYWLADLAKILEDAKADIISPNVSETNAAHKYGVLNIREEDFIPSKIVGGLWFMKKEMIKDIYFESFSSTGIRAAFNIITQIVAHKNPKIGWTDKVTYQDIGFWSGSHPKHIKSEDHANYSREIGRRIAWQPGDKC